MDDDTERIPIQIRRGSTNTESPPVDDNTEQFPVWDEEELTGIVGSPPKHFGDWCSHTSGS